MCEPKLSTNTESLLARIDALESEMSKIKLGRSEIPATPTETAPRAEQAEPAPAKETAQAPAPKPQTREAAPQMAPQPTPPPISKPSNKGTGAPVFRAIAAWRDVVEKVARVRPGMGGFLESARAYRGDDKRTYLIRVSSTFTAKMLSRPDSLEAIKLALAEETGADLATLNLRIVAEGEEAGGTLVDEIEEALHH